MAQLVVSDRGNNIHTDQGGPLHPGGTGARSWGIGGRGLGPVGISAQESRTAAVERHALERELFPQKTGSRKACP